MMNGRGKSDSSVVPGKPPNRAEEPAAEVVEGRGLAKGNRLEQNASRTLCRSSAPSELERMRRLPGWHVAAITQGRSPVR